MLAKNLVAFHETCKLLRATRCRFHCSFTFISTGLLEVSIEEGSKMSFKLCVALYTTWL